MEVTREVVLDLLPLYLAGEASPASRAAVEEFLQRDPELAQSIRSRWVENLARVVPSPLPPDLELRSLRRTRNLLAVQRWLFAFGICFTGIGVGFEVRFEHGALQYFRPLLWKYPLPIGACLALGIACWVAYHAIRRRLHTGVS